MGNIETIFVAIWNRDLVRLTRTDSITMGSGEPSIGQAFGVESYDEIMEPKKFIRLCKELFKSWILIYEAGADEIIVKIKSNGEQKEFSNSFEACKFIKDNLEGIGIDIIYNEDTIKSDAISFLDIEEYKDFFSLKPFKINPESLTP